MSISNSLANALSGISAASRKAEIVSSNIANATTEGYGRRSLEIGSATVGGVGAGVRVGDVIRHIDKGVLSDRRMADASLGSASAKVAMFNDIQGLIGSAGEQGSISSRIVALEESLISASSDPSSSVRLAGVNESLTALTTALNSASDGIQKLREDADYDIAVQVDTLNSTLKQVEQLNGDITRAVNTGVDPSGLIDQRQVAIDRIAEIVPVRELERQNGRVALMTVQGQMLVDGPAAQFEFTRNPVITPDMTLASGGLSALSLDGEGVSGAMMRGGTLEAAFSARDQDLVVAQDNLDTVAADLMSRFEDPAVDPTISAGAAGLFTDAGAPFDATSQLGLAGRISVNAAVDPAQGGQLSNIRDGVGAAAVGLAGDASLIERLSEALSAPSTAPGDTTMNGAVARAAQFEAEAGQQRNAMEFELSFATARWSSLKEAEAAGGVDSDFEMQMLLNIEQSFAANARVIEVVNSMMQSILEL